MLKTVSVLAAVVSVLWATDGATQTAALCGACLASAHCEDAAGTCTPACEARYFTVDPRRATCVAQCASTRNQCERSAQSTCQQQKACR